MRGPWLTLGVVLVVLAARPSAAQLDSDSALPESANLDVPAVYRPTVEMLWRRSPTFRRQWRRLAAGGIRVVVLADGTRPRGLANARTDILRRPDEPATAYVHVPPSRDLPQYLAHELEHVIEQLDGVDLADHVDTGTVWASRSVGYETVRAVEAGRRVAQEMDGSVRIGESAMASPEEPVVRLAQHERESSPVSPRSSRVSADGRYVVFVSAARLVDDDRDNRRDVYVFDRLTGRHTRESGGPAGAADGESRSADISADGRFVVFGSEARNLVPSAPASSTEHVYVRDRVTGALRLLSVDRDGAPARGRNANPVISADGAVVAFESTSDDIVDAPPGGPGRGGIYAVRLADGRRMRVDVHDATGRACGPSMTPSISADGRLVAFASKGRLFEADDAACRAAPPEAGGTAHVYVRDLQAGRTTLVSGRSGAPADGASYDPAISGDGRYVAFVSDATNLARGTAGRPGQVYLHDLARRETALVSRTPASRPGNARSLRPAISFDGGVVAFQSLASDLECAGRCSRDRRDVNLVWDVFVHDRALGRTRRATAGPGWLAGGRAPALDAAGRVLALASTHQADSGDETHDEDLYLLRAVPEPIQARRQP